MAMFNVQRAITPKAGKPELRFMCPARRLIVLYICVMFGENISDGIRDLERTRMMETLTDGRTDGHTKNFGRYNTIPSRLFVAGHKNLKCCLNLTEGNPRIM